MTLDRKWQIAEPPPPGFRLDLGALGSGVRGPLAARLLWHVHKVDVSAEIGLSKM